MDIVYRMINARSVQEELQQSNILNGCPASLSSGMYKWRHDQVLKEIGIAVRAVVNQVNEILAPSKSVKHIDFVKEGGEVFIQQVDHQTGILHSANNWTLSP